MANFDFLQKYIRLQQGIMLDEVVDLEFATVGISLTDKSGYWNNALTNQILDETEISKIEDLFKLKGRNYSIYFENTSELNDLAIKLKQRDYKKTWEDCWLFWSGRRIEANHFENIKKVETPEQLRVYLDIFNACYQKDDPQNPYGELGEYLIVAESVWQKYRGTNRLEYFIVYEDTIPVAVSTLTNFEGIGYISNVGSLRKVRGKGYGKAATLFCIDKSIKNGNTEHCLATEGGTYPNEFYKRIGFISRFKAVGYSK